MTREEYMARTNIKSPDEARNHLRKLNTLTALIVILGAAAVVLYALNPDRLFFLFPFVPAILLALYGERHSDTLIKALGLQRLATFEYATETAYSFYGLKRYQAIKKVLEIISGKRELSAEAIADMQTDSRPPQQTSSLSKAPRSLQYTIFIIAMLLIFLFVYLGMK